MTVLSWLPENIQFPCCWWKGWNTCPNPISGNLVTAELCEIFQTSCGIIVQIWGMEGNKPNFKSCFCAIAVVVFFFLKGHNQCWYRVKELFLNIPCFGGAKQYLYNVVVTHLTVSRPSQPAHCQNPEQLPSPQWWDSEWRWTENGPTSELHF